MEPGEVCRFNSDGVQQGASGAFNNASGGIQGFDREQHARADTATQAQLSITLAAAFRALAESSMPGPTLQHKHAHAGPLCVHVASMHNP